MTTATISDQFFAASEKFHQARNAYAAERAALQELEQELLKYTEDYQTLQEQAHNVGDGNWRVFNGTLSAAKRGVSPCYWVYVCNTLSGDGVSFEEASEAVAFLAGHYLADKWHQEMNEKIEAAQQQSDEDEASHLTQPE